jgi:hypothetical protein
MFSCCTGPLAENVADPTRSSLWESEARSPVTLLQVAESFSVMELRRRLVVPQYALPLGNASLPSAKMRILTPLPDSLSE